MKKYACGFVFNMSMDRILLTTRNYDHLESNNITGISFLITEEKSAEEIKKELSSVLKKETYLNIDNWEYMSGSTTEDSHTLFFYAKTPYFDEYVVSGGIFNEVKDYDVNFLPQKMTYHYKSLVDLAIILDKNKTERLIKSLDSIKEDH